MLESFRDTFFMSMLNKFAVFVVGAVAALYAQCSLAVGFGRASHSTSLGQALEMVVPVIADSTEQLTNDCLSAEVLVGDTRLHPSTVRSRLDWLGDSGVRVLRVLTSSRIDEPVVTVTVGVGCPPRLTRQFVLFIDPPAAGLDPVITAPLVSPSETVQIASGTVGISGAPEAPASAPAEASPAMPPVSVANDERPSARASHAPKSSRKHPKRVRAPATAGVAASGGDAVALVGKAAVSKSVPETRHAARLQLEPDARPGSAVHVAASAAGLAASAASAADAAASEAEAAAQRQREALESLQKQMETLKAQAEASNRSILQMQSSLREAGEVSNWWIYVSSMLAAAVVALLVWVAWLLRQRAAAAKAGAWWNAESQRAPLDDTRGRAGASGKATPGPDSVQESSRWDSGVVVPDTAVGVLTDFDPKRTFADEAPTSTGFDTPRTADENLSKQGFAPLLTADELIDLGQQAEFFVALGQDDSAVDLLERHLPDSGGGGAWPYLKLLEIYRRKSDRVAFDLVCEKFERRFGVSPAAWLAPSIAGKSLDAYSEVVRRIEAVWAEPDQAMSLIETLMIQGDADSKFFDLAAMVDLESLYLLARSLRVPAQPEAGSVDLLLPLDSRGSEPSRDLPLQVGPAEEPKVDFNLELQRPDEEPGSLK